MNQEMIIFLIHIYSFLIIETKQRIYIMPIFSNIVLSKHAIDRLQQRFGIEQISKSNSFIKNKIMNNEAELYFETSDTLYYKVKYRNHEILCVIAEPQTPEGSHIVSTVLKPSETSKKKLIASDIENELKKLKKNIVNGEKVFGDFLEMKIKFPFYFSSKKRMIVSILKDKSCAMNWKPLNVKYLDIATRTLKKMKSDYGIQGVIVTRNKKIELDKSKITEYDEVLYEILRNRF